jgi:N-acetylmuramoyl-L-alanine amidase
MKMYQSIGLYETFMTKTFFPLSYPKLLSFTVVFFVATIVVGCSHKVASLPPAGSAPRTSAPVSTPTAPPSPDSGTKVVEKCFLDPGTSQTIIHEVAPLETIWRISKMYGVPIDSIYAANSLKPGDAIYQGQKLTIPNARAFRNIIPLYPNSRWKYIVIHHTATDVGKAYLIHRTHQDRGFWNGLGYHFLIDNGTLGKGDGQIEAAPRWIKQQSGAHCNSGGMNEKGIGIALVGNFNEELPTEKQRESLIYLVKTLCQYYRIPASHIIGHRDAPGASTECPGKRFPLATVRQCLDRP